MSDIRAELPVKSSHKPVEADKTGYLAAALAGDQFAFERLTESHRREILTHRRDEHFYQSGAVSLFQPACRIAGVKRPMTQFRNKG
jgi:hypothetical protein